MSGLFEAQKALRLNQMIFMDDCRGDGHLRWRREQMLASALGLGRVSVPRCKRVLRIRFETGAPEPPKRIPQSLHARPFTLSFPVGFDGWLASHSRVLSCASIKATAATLAPRETAR